MVQLLQNLADEFADFAQGMVRGNPLLRMNVRKHPACILRPSAHLQSSRRIRGELNHHSFALARFFSKLLAALRDSPHVNDKVRLSEEEIQKLSPMGRPIVNKPLGVAYGTGELPAMIASSRDYHAYRSKGHVPGDLIPIANTNHFTILDELRQPNSTLTRAVIAMAEYQTA